jgi:hypothetical protein
MGPALCHKSAQQAQRIYRSHARVRGAWCWGSFPVGSGDSCGGIFAGKRGVGLVLGESRGGLGRDSGLILGGSVDKLVFGLPLCWAYCEKNPRNIGDLVGMSFF